MLELSSYENIQQSGYLNVNQLEDVLKGNPGFSVTDMAVIKFRISDKSSEDPDMVNIVACHLSKGS